MELLHNVENEPTALQQTPTEEVVSSTPSIVRLQKAIARRRRSYNFSKIVCSLTLSVELATLPLVVHATLTDTAENSLKCLLVWAFSSLLGLAISAGYLWHNKKELKQAVVSLAGVTRGDAIGPLIETVRFYDACYSIVPMGSDGGVYQVAVQNLMRLLPHLSEEDSSLINAQQFRQLPHILKDVVYPRFKGRCNIPFAVAILNVLEQIGDSAAIPIVERIAKRTPQQDEPSLREAAVACLSRLRERSQEVELQSCLLRASSSVPTNTLLRAAIETSPTDPTQLLRAGQKDSE
ncbi:MAG: hypothetical protein JWL77_6486 [Chthonomonadaceae bacterium]|nr:hypothetical protein [Chthonomonadaceae bacterium]